TSSLNSSTPTATLPTAATTATSTAATTAATKAPTPATTPTTSTTSTTSTTPTAAPTTTPAATATTPATLALVAVAIPTSRSSPDILSTKDVNSSSRGVGRGKKGGGTPLKEGCSSSATSGTYSDYASLSCKEEDFECLAAAVPRFASMLLALEGDPDAPDIPTPRSHAEAIMGPYSSQWQAAMDAKMASWKSTGTYLDEVPPPGANIVEGMWIFRVKRPPGSPPAFKARYVARYSLPAGLRARGDLVALTTWFHWDVSCRTTLAALGFAPSFADPSQFLRTNTLLPPFYVLVYVDDLVFATADTRALTLVKSELQKRHTCSDLGELRSYLGLQITRDRARRTITLTQSHMVHQVLQRFGFQFSSPQPTPLSTSHLLSTPPSDESVEPSGPYPELVGCLITSGMGLVLGGRGPVVLTGHADVSWVDDSATQRSSHGRHLQPWFRLCFLVELRWLTYLLTDLGEQPHSPPVLYVDNKAMMSNIYA
ncbi:unnamed protein product, partial [Closterium sp. NIES-54]